MTEALPRDNQNKATEIGSQGLASMFVEANPALPTGTSQPLQVMGQLQPEQMQSGQVAPQVQTNGLAAYGGLQGQQQMNQPQNQYQIMGGVQLI